MSNIAIKEEIAPRYIECISRIPEIPMLCGKLWYIDLNTISGELAHTLKHVILLQNLSQAARELRWKGLAREDNIQLLMDILLFLHQNELAYHQDVWNLLNIGDISFVLSIRSCGEGWDECLDERGAHLIIDIQNSINSLYRELLGADYVPPRLRFRIQKGSNEILATAERLLSQAINTMTPDQIFYFLLTVGGLIFAGFAMCKFFAHKQHMELIKINAKKQTDKHEEVMTSLKLVEQGIGELRELISQVIASTNAYTKPMNNYIHTMSSNDHIDVAKMGRVSVPEARKALRYERKRKNLVKVACDGKYTISGIDMKKHPIRITIAQGETSISASLHELPVEKRSDLVEDVRTALDGGKLPLVLDLQVNISCSKLNRVNASIIGIGAPRKGISQYFMSELPASIQSIFD